MLLYNTMYVPEQVFVKLLQHTVSISNMEADSPILIELNSDLQALGQICESEITDDHSIITSFFKTLESVLRHGLVRDSREFTDFFDVILILYNQQNTCGRKLLKQITD